VRPTHPGATAIDPALAAVAPPAGERHEPPLPAAVLWDMDGTLVDTEPYWFAAERDLVDRFGHGDWPDELAAGMVGFDLLDGAAYLQRHGGVDLPAEEIVDRLLDGVIARLHRRIPWQPGARELLAELRAAGVPCVLVTMSWRRFVDPVLAALPPGSFVASVTGDEVPLGEGKPEPTPYLLGAEAAGAHPADCVAIEDSPTGVRSALGAGCVVLGIPNVRDLEPAPGLTIVESLDGVDLASLEALFLEPAAAPPRRARAISIRRGPLLVVGALVLIAIVALLALGRGGDEGLPDLPPGAIRVDVWAPYWTLGDTVPEADRRLDQVREISPFWYDAVGVDEIVVNPNASTELTEQFLDAAADSRGRLVPSIRDAMPAGGMAAILANPETRERHVDTIVEFAESLDADGIDIDYEQFAFADGGRTWAATQPNWVAFVEELADALHADDRTLTVSIPPVYDEATTGNRGYWVYDHGAIAEHVDALRIMAYDYSVGEAGPISPLAWVADAIEGVSLAVPEEHHDKLVLGVPTYGSNWVVSTVGDCPPSAEGRTNVTARSIDALAERRDGVPEYDAVTGEWSFTYALEVSEGAMSCIQNRAVHWVDAEGAAARTHLAREAGWGGVSLWALGYEDAEAWTALVNAATLTVTTQPPD
jgi:HAD superfamily hydrolase (TIGR01509 family)